MKPDIRELARANKVMVDADRGDCERFRVRGFLGTFYQSMSREEVREVIAAIECDCRGCCR
jgi:hypothetical protein